MARKKAPKISISSARRVLGLLRPHRGVFIWGMIALAIGSGINLLFPEVIRRLLSDQYTGYLMAHPWRVACGLIGLLAVQGVAFYYRAYIFSIIGQRVVADLRNKLYQSILGQSLGFFDAERAGDLVTRLSSDTLLIQNAVSVNLAVIIRYLVQVVAGIALMATLSLHLTALIVISLPILVVTGIVMGKWLRKYSKLQQEALSASTTVAEETFSAARVVKAFGREGYEARRYGNANSNVLLYGEKRSFVAAFFSSFVNFLMNAIIVIVLFYGVQQVFSQGMGAGDLTAFLLYGVIVAVSFAFLAGAYAEFAQAVGASERVFDLLSKVPSVRDPEVVLPLPTDSSGVVSFDNVSFAYPTRPDITVLNGITLSLKPGRTVALVGPSGSGKSSIVNLLFRFYDPSSGKIVLDGVDLKDLPRALFLSRMALVPQESQVFAVSIAENLRYGKEDATDEELREVCRRANILDFVEGLPEKFATNVGDRGVQLSGGQKQRLSIARAMLRNPAILVLDEATSALDSENEAHIQSALKELMRGRASLVVAHRLSTTRHADEIIVLKQGEIVQRGSHDVLTQQPGLYKDLVDRQELV